MLFNTWQTFLLISGYIFISTNGAEKENSIPTTTTPPDYNNDYPDNNYDDYADRDYPHPDYEDDNRGRSLTHDDHEEGINDIPDPLDDENFLRQLRSTIPGVPGVDYPLHRSVPHTGFSCENHRSPGFYGDVEAQCQVFHICQEDNRSDSFLCPIGTVFNQMSFVCDWWFNFRCSDTPNFYRLNSGRTATETSTQSAMGMVRDTAARMRRFRSMDRVMNLFSPKMRSRNIWKRLRATEPSVAASTYPIRSDSDNAVSNNPYKDTSRNTYTKPSRGDSDNVGSNNPYKDTSRNTYTKPSRRFSDSVASNNPGVHGSVINYLYRDDSGSTKPTKPSKEDSDSVLPNNPIDPSFVSRNVSNNPYRDYTDSVASTNPNSNDSLYSSSTDPSEKDSESRTSTGPSRDVSESFASTDPYRSDSVSETESSTFSNVNSLPESAVEWDEPRSKVVVHPSGEVDGNYRTLEYSISSGHGHLEKASEGEFEQTKTSMERLTTPGMEWKELKNSINIKRIHTIMENTYNNKTLLEQSMNLNVDEERLNPPIEEVLENGLEIVSGYDKSNTDKHVEEPLTELSTPPLNSTKNKMLRDLHVHITSDKLIDELLPLFYDRNLNETGIFVTSPEHDSMKQNLPGKTLNSSGNSKEDNSVQSQIHKPLNAVLNNNTTTAGLGNETHISVSVTIRASTGISRLKWKRIPGYRRKKQSLLKSGQKDEFEEISPMDPIFIKRMMGRSKPSSRIMWIPTKNRTLNRKNYWRIFINSMPKSMLENITKINGLKEMMTAELSKDHAAPINIQDSLGFIEETTILPQTTLKFESSEMTMDVVVPSAPSIAESGSATQPDDEVALYDSQPTAAGTASKICEAFCAKLIQSFNLTSLENDNLIGSVPVDDSILPTEAVSESEQTDGKLEEKISEYSASEHDQEIGNNDDSQLIRALNNEAPYRNTRLKSQLETNDNLVTRNTNEDAMMQSRLGRRSFLGISPADDWAVKHDSSPDCNDEPDDGETQQVRGWSVIIDSGLVTKEKTVKKRGCQSIFNDSKIIVMQSKYPTHDVNLREPEEDHRNSRITFGSSDQQYWFNLVKNWLESSAENPNDSKNDGDLFQELRSSEGTGNYQERASRHNYEPASNNEWDGNRFFSRTQDQISFKRFNNGGQRNQRDLEDGSTNRHSNLKNSRFGIDQEPQQDFHSRPSRNFQNIRDSSSNMRSRNWNSDIDSSQSDRKEWHLDMDRSVSKDALPRESQPRFFNTDKPSSTANKKIRPRSGTSLDWSSSETRDSSLRGGPLDWSSSETSKDTRPRGKGWAPDQTKIDVPIASSDWSLDSEENKTPQTRIRQSKWDNDEASWNTQQTSNTNKGSARRQNSKPANAPKDWDSGQKKISSWSGDDSSISDDGWKDVGSNENPWRDDNNSKGFGVGSSKSNWSNDKPRVDDWSAMKGSSRTGTGDQRSKINNDKGSRTWSSSGSRGKADTDTGTKRSNKDWSGSGDKPRPKGDWSSDGVSTKDRPSSGPKDSSNSKGKTPSTNSGGSKHWSSSGRKRSDDWSGSEQKKEDWSSIGMRDSTDWSSSEQMKEDWPSSAGSRNDWSATEQKKDDWSPSGKSNRDWSSGTPAGRTDWSSDDQQKKDVSSGNRQGRKDWSSEDRQEKKDWSSSGNGRSDGQKRNTGGSSSTKGANEDWRDTAQTGSKSFRSDWSSSAKGPEKTNLKGSGKRWPTTIDKPDSQKDISDWPLDDEENTKTDDWSSKKPKTDGSGWTDDEFIPPFKGDTRDEQSRIPWTQDEERTPSGWNNKGTANDGKKNKGSQKQPDWSDGPSRIPKGFTREKPPSSNPWSSGTKGTDRRFPNPSKKGISTGTRRKGAWDPDDSQVRDISQKTDEDVPWDSPSGGGFGSSKRKPNTGRSKGPWDAGSSKSSGDSPSDWSSNKGFSQDRSSRRQSDWEADDAQETFVFSSGEDWSTGSKPKPDWAKGIKSSMPRSGLSGSDDWPSESNRSQGRKGGSPSSKRGGTKTAVAGPGRSGTPPSKPWKDDRPMGSSKGDPGKKEEKIVWSVQISSNGKPGNGWVPITLRPDLQTRRNQTTKGSTMGDEDWPMDSWSVKGASSTVTPKSLMVTEDTVTETMPTSSEFPDASDRHQSFYIPSERGRYRRNAMSRNAGYRIYRAFNKKEEVDDGSEDHRFYLAGADIVVEGNRVEPKRRFKPPRKEFNETIKNSVPSLTELRRKLTSKKLGARENGTEVRSEWDNVMQQSEKRESWSEPLNDSNVPASGWIPLFRVRKLPENFPIPPSLELYYRGNESLDDQGGETVSNSNDSSPVLKEVETYSTNPPQPVYKNTTVEGKGRGKNHEQEMRVGNKTLRVIPFSDVMKQLEPNPQDSSNLQGTDSNESSGSEEEWNIPITAAPKTYSLKFVNQSEMQGRNLSSSWTFGNRSKGKDAWILVRGEKEKETSSSATHPASEPAPFVEKNNTVYKIIVGNRTRHQVGPASNKEESPKKDVPIHEIKSSKEDMITQFHKSDKELKVTPTTAIESTPNRFLLKHNIELSSNFSHYDVPSPKEIISNTAKDSIGDGPRDGKASSERTASAKLQKESTNKTEFLFDLKNWNTDSSWTPLLRGVGRVSVKDLNRPLSKNDHR